MANHCSVKRENSSAWAIIENSWINISPPQGVLFSWSMLYCYIIFISMTQYWMLCTRFELKRLEYAEMTLLASLNNIRNPIPNLSTKFAKCFKLFKMHSHKNDLFIKFESFWWNNWSSFISFMHSGFCSWVNPPTSSSSYQLHVKRGVVMIVSFLMW